MRIKCLAQGNNILLPGFEPSTSVSKTDILANRPICSYAIRRKDTVKKDYMERTVKENDFDNNVKGDVVEGTVNSVNIDVMAQALK